MVLGALLEDVAAGFETPAREAGVNLSVETGFLAATVDREFLRRPVVNPREASRNPAGRPYLPGRKISSGGENHP